MKDDGVTAEVIRYIKTEFDREPDFLWAKTPNNAAFRHKGNKKWFAALMMDMPGQVLGLAVERVDVLNVKLDPRMVASLVDGRRYLPGYHMNKEHWISLVLDGSIPLPEIFGLIGMSYELTNGKKRAVCHKEQLFTHQS